MLQYVITIKIQTENKPVVTGLKMLQYVMKVDPNSAVSYWPKMSQYVITVKMQTANKPVVFGLKCYST